MRHATLETGGRDSSARTGEGGWASWTAQALFAWTRTHDEPGKSGTFGYIAAGLLCADVSFTHRVLARFWAVGAKASHGNNRLLDACFRVFARCAKKRIFNSFTSFSRWKWFILSSFHHFLNAASTESCSRRQLRHRVVSEVFVDSLMRLNGVDSGYLSSRFVSHLRLWTEKWTWIWIHFLSNWCTKKIDRKCTPRLVQVSHICIYWKARCLGTMKAEPPVDWVRVRVFLPIQYLIACRFHYPSTLHDLRKCVPGRLILLFFVVPFFFFVFRNLLRPAGVELAPCTFTVRLYRAEDVPQSEWSLCVSNFLYTWSQSSFLFCRWLSI